MTIDLGIQSMDAVSSGDWLVVNRGPLSFKKGEGGTQKSYYPPEYEGLLVNVLAVSPPILMVRVFPFKDTVGFGKPLVTAWHWDRQRFSRATDGYVNTYLDLCGYTRDGGRKRGKDGDEEAAKPQQKPKRKVTRKVIIDGKIQTIGDDND